MISNLGAELLPGGGARFRVWAPHARTIALRLNGARPQAMARSDAGVFELDLRTARPGADYVYVLDGDRELPDPRSRFQPHGVHGPSRLYDPHAFAWSDRDFNCPALRSFVIYELHVGTFTPEGTFAAAIPKLAHLRALGVSAVELMPVAEFPGARNWGYDGVCAFAPQSSYGGPDGLKRLVDACHAHGLAVVLDVVYNHFGPEGNYLGDFGPYVTNGHGSAWGDAVNFDGPGSEGVRQFVIDNALYWLREYHVDALRLDAIQGIHDRSLRHVLAELQAEVQEQCMRIGRPAFLIAESDLNDARVLIAEEAGGLGLDAQWNDDFHHALHTLLVPEQRGYFADFGRIADLSKALCEGFVYDGRHSPFRNRRHGSSSAELPGSQFTVYSQNHDQIANAACGQRLARLCGAEACKLAAAVVACAPNLPLLFQGEEFFADTPFHYFVSHSDPGVIAAVREGRRAEHQAFGDEDEWADPQDEHTFTASKLDWSCVERAVHGQVLAFYRALYALRRRRPALSGCHKELARATGDEGARWLVLERGHPSGEAALCVFNFAAEPRRVTVALAPGNYLLELSSSDPRYGGAPGSAQPSDILRAFDREPVVVTVAPLSAAIYLSTGA